MTEIQQIRDTLGLTQAQLGERLGLNQATISRMESGAVPIDKRTLIAARTLLPKGKRTAA